MYAKDKIHCKVRDHCHFTSKYIGTAHSICNRRHNAPNEIPVIFNNRLNYDYHFIIKELASDCEGPFGCLSENTQK